jgi:hypothetical protein
MVSRGLESCIYNTAPLENCIVDVWAGDVGYLLRWWLLNGLISYQNEMSGREWQVLAGTDEFIHFEFRLGVMDMMAKVKLYK